jgi:hypothetical protein
MTFFRIYGFQDSNLDRVREQVERQLGVRFRERDSSEEGLYYIYDSTSDRIVLYPNSDGDGPLRDKFAHWPVLLNVESSDRDEGVTVDGAVLLETQEWPGQ